MEALRHLVDSEPESTSVSIEFADIESLEELCPLLQRLPCLQELSLQGNNLSSLPGDLSYLSALRKLDISSNSFPALSPAVLTGLKSLPALRSLLFSFDSDSDEAALLAELPALTELNEKAVHVEVPLRSSRRGSTLSTSQSSMVSELRDTPAKEGREGERRKEPETVIVEMILPDMSELQETVHSTIRALLVTIREAGLPGLDLRTEIEEGVKAVLARQAGNPSLLRTELTKVAKSAYVSVLGTEKLRKATGLIEELAQSALEEEKSAAKQRETLLSGELERANIRVTALTAEKDVLLIRLKEASQALAQASEGFKAEIAVYEGKLMQTESEKVALRTENGDLASLMETLRTEKAAFQQALKDAEDRTGKNQTDQNKGQIEAERLLKETRNQCETLENALQESKRREESLAAALQTASSGSEAHQTALQTLRNQLEREAEAAVQEQVARFTALSADKAALESRFAQISADKEEIQAELAAFRIKAAEAEIQSQAEIQQLQLALQEAQIVIKPPAVTMENQQIQVEMPSNEANLRRVVSQSPSRKVVFSQRKGHTRVRSNVEKPLSLHQLLQTIATLHASKTHFGGQKETYMEHLQAAMQKTYGLKAVSAAACARVLTATEIYKEGDCDVELFRRLVYSEVEDKYVRQHESVRKQLQDSLLSSVKDKYPLKPGKEIEQIFHMHLKGFLSLSQAMEILARLFPSNDLEAIKALLTDFAQSNSKLDTKIPYKDFLQLVLRYTLDRHQTYLSPLLALWNQQEVTQSGRISQAGFREVMGRLGVEDRRVIGLLRAADPENVQTVTFAGVVEAVESEGLLRRLGSE